MTALWTFLSKGGWILLAAGVLVGWVHSEKKRAEEVGEQKARAEALQKVADSLSADLAAYVASVVSADQRADSMAAVLRHHDEQAAKMDTAGRRSSSRANATIQQLRDSLPGLAGRLATIQAALDTANARADTEALARTDAEGINADLRGRLEKAEALVARAAVVVPKENQATKELVKQIGSGHGFSVLDGVLATIATVATVVVVAHH